MQMSVATIVTYDVYRAYISPNASGAALLRMQRGIILLFGSLSGVIAIILTLTKVTCRAAAEQLPVCRGGCSVQLTLGERPQQDCLPHN
jgi:hypothetical protein